MGTGNRLKTAYLGLAALRKAWWNTEGLWAGSLIAIGSLSLLSAV